MDKMQQEAEEFVKPSVAPDQQADPSVRIGSPYVPNSFYVRICHALSLC